MPSKPHDLASDADLMAVDTVTLQKLRVFQVVAEFGHFTRAAEFLNISQPVISSHIRLLEQRVGAQLFQRVGRGVALTEAGKRVFRWASEILVETADMQRDLQKIQGGSLGETVISASPSVGSYPLAQLVTDFVRLNPGVRIDLKITNPTAAVDAVRTGQAAFAVSLLDPSQPIADLALEVVWRERYRLVCKPGSPWSDREITLAELATIPIITGNPGPVRYSIEDSKLIELGVAQRNIILEYGHPEPVKKAALLGLGCAFLFDSTSETEREAGNLVEVNVPGLKITNPIYLVHRRRKMLSPTEIHLIEYIRTNHPIQ